MKEFKGLSMIVPCFNEVESIEKTIEDLYVSINSSEIDFEIIVVDDASTDGSYDKLKELNFKKLVLVKNDSNRGYGASLKTGIRHSRFEWVGTCDADGTYPVDKIPELLQEMNNHNMVVGSRTGKNVKIPLMRRPAKWFLNKLANYLTEVKIPDINSGLRVFRKEDCLKFVKILPNNFSFSTTITLSMLTNNMSVKYVPIDYKKRTGKSKIKPIRDTLSFILLIIRTVLYFNPLKVFLPLSALVFLSSVFVFIYSFIMLPKILDSTVLLLFLTSVQILAIGMLADIIEKRSGK